MRFLRTANEATSSVRRNPGRAGSDKGISQSVGGIQAGPLGRARGGIDMSNTLTAEDMADEVAVSVAHILAAANRRARQLGCDVSKSLVTISQHFENGGFWRINY